MPDKASRKDASSLWILRTVSSGPTTTPDIVSRVEHDYPGDDTSAIITLADALGRDAALALIQKAGWSEDRTKKALEEAY